MKLEYITLDLMTIEGIKKAEQLQRRGWKTIRSSLFSITLSKR